MSSSPAWPSPASDPLTARWLSADTPAWADARAIRHVVFVEEQACPPDEEWDAYDTDARHLVLYVDGAAVGTMRWRAVVYDGVPTAKLERFAVRGPWRGRGLGHHLVTQALADVQAAGYRRVLLHAQAHLEAFYAQHGFQATDERFEEVGIPHVKMWWAAPEPDR